LRAVGDHSEPRKNECRPGKRRRSEIATNKFSKGGTKSDKQKYLDKIDAETRRIRDDPNLTKNSRTTRRLQHHKENVAEIEAEYRKGTPEGV